MTDNSKNEFPDVSTMSDEDFLALDPSVFNEAPMVKKEDDNDEGEDTPEDIEEARRAALTDKELAVEDNEEDGRTPEEIEEERREALTQEERNAEDAQSKEKGATAAATEEARRETLTDDERAAEDAAGADPDKADEKNDETTDTQYIDIGKQIMGGIQANGQTLKIKSVEDAIQLIQMGANYHKKMTGLKPSLKTLKLLENHDLLDPKKLNYLIDLHQKKPEAITQLLRDSKIDPMDIDLKDGPDYVPDQRSVSDTEIALDGVLEGIEESKFYNQTLTVIGTDWDDTSRSHIAENPEIIRTINSHMENGVYQQVADAVAYERTLGKLGGVSDFDAYSQMGQHMHENKLFSANVNSPEVKPNHKTRSPQNKGETPEQKAQRLDRKKAASPSRQKKAPAKSEEKYNPLSMSDEEFIKFNKLSV